MIATGDEFFIAGVLSFLKSSISITLGAIRQAAAKKAAQAAVAQAAGNEVSSGIRLVNGRAPVNSRYAGGVHPAGVEFTAEGFPRFGPFAKARVQIDGLTGNVVKDAALANKAMGYPSTPRGFTWHHVEDALSMELVPSALHEAVRHTGGAAIIRGLLKMLGGN